MAQSVDVLIVGAGPTGLTLALELARQDISFRIIDKAPSLTDQSKALVMQPRSVELLDRHGLGQELLSSGVNLTGITIVVKGKKVTEIPVNEIANRVKDSFYARPLIIAQSDTEKILHDRLLQYGHTLERGVVAKNIVQDDNGVNAILEDSSGIQTSICASYVIGADGAHSVVRHASDTFTFDGAAYAQNFILCDAHIQPPRTSDNLYMCLGHGQMALLPLKDGMVRIIITLPTKLDNTELRLVDFQNFLDAMIPGHGSLYDPTWMTRFSLHHRGVNLYRDRRLLVAGDAAHIHSPVGGQGMNTGIQDAINLGWKLGAVIRGERPDSFLDTYHQERHPVGQQLLEYTDRAFTWLTWSNPVYMCIRNALLPLIAPLLTRNPDRLRQGYLFVSEFAISYANSPIVGKSPRFQGPVVGGSRAPDGRLIGKNGERKTLYETLSADHHSLVLFAGSGLQAASPAELEAAKEKFLHTRPQMSKTDVYHVHSTEDLTILESNHFWDMEESLHQSYGFKVPGYAYIRPDFYIAHIGLLPSPDELFSELAHI